MFLLDLTSIKYSILNFIHLVLALLLLTAKEMLVIVVVQCSDCLFWLESPDILISPFVNAM